MNSTVHRPPPLPPAIVGRSATIKYQNICDVMWIFVLLYYSWAEREINNSYVESFLLLNL